jgi:hypothetical protein
VKNITISVDDAIYRAARICAAERGTSVSAMVKAYLTEITETTPDHAFGVSIDNVKTPAMGVREMPMSFTPSPLAMPPIATRKPRQPGGLRGQIGMADDFESWPDDVTASFDAWPYDNPSAPA